MTTRQTSDTVETELRAIERRVFEDVWISAPRARVLAALATALTVSAVALQATGATPAGVTRNGHWISLVAFSCSLSRHRDRHSLCCAAVFDGAAWRCARQLSPVWSAPGRSGGITPHIPLPGFRRHWARSSLRH